jgi:hypothetical protein
MCNRSEFGISIIIFHLPCNSGCSIEYRKKKAARPPFLGFINSKILFLTSYIDIVSENLEKILYLIFLNCFVESDKGIFSSFCFKKIVKTRQFFRPPDSLRSFMQPLACAASASRCSGSSRRFCPRSRWQPPRLRTEEKEEGWRKTLCKTSLYK